MDSESTACPDNPPASTATFIGQARAPEVCADSGSVVAAAPAGGGWEGNGQGATRRRLQTVEIEQKSSPARAVQAMQRDVPLVQFNPQETEPSPCASLESRVTTYNPPADHEVVSDGYELPPAIARPRRHGGAGRVISVAKEISCSNSSSEGKWVTAPSAPAPRGEGKHPPERALHSENNPLSRKSHSLASLPVRRDERIPECQTPDVSVHCTCDLWVDWGSVRDTHVIT